ncbi:MAG: phenylacetate--CoA ligase family protein, partial [Candidatus Cloacimonetes bacterium]|nr:phenylacetate--CoA ligase family protein [Candidatus Cloacimonadota bacterium]
MSQLIDKISSIIKNRYYQTVVYKRYSKFAIESQYWSKDKWLDWQWMQIKELLEYAYQWVPYYSNLFKDIGLTPQDIISWDRFREIPILSKKIVRQNEKQLLTTHPGERKKAIAFSSSGSTGLPLRFYTNREQQIVTSAFMDFQWSRIGYTRNSSRVVIRGLYSPKLISKMSPRDWNISVCGLSDENLPEITSFLNKTKPDYLHAFPSSLWTLTNLMNKHSITLNYKPKGLLIGSEKYPNEYRTLFEGFYECKSYSWLGLAEGTILAGECENTDDLHVIPAYSYVELEKNSESKEILNGDMIIGTSLHNRAFPFIRYYCGDLAIPVESDCVCGRGYQI